MNIDRLKRLRSPLTSLALAPLAWTAIMVVASACRGQSARVEAPPPSVLVKIAYAEGHRDVPSLAEALTVVDVEVRRRAVRALGRIGGEEARRVLRQAWPEPSTGLDDDYAVAWALAGGEAEWLMQGPMSPARLWALGRVATGVAEPYWTRGLEHAEARVREEAALSLGVMGQRSISWSATIETLLVKNTRHADRGVRSAAVFALSRAEPPAAEPAVVSALVTASADASPEVRSLALYGLERRGQVNLEIFEKALGDPDGRVVVQAVRALSGSNSQPSHHGRLADWIASSLERGQRWPAILEGIERLSHYVEEAQVERAMAQCPAAVQHQLSKLVAATAHCRCTAAMVRRGAPYALLNECGGKDHEPYMTVERNRLAMALIQRGVGEGIRERLQWFEQARHNLDPRVRALAITGALASEDRELRTAGNDAAALALAKEKASVVVGSVADAIGTDGIAPSDALRRAIVERARQPQDDPELQLSLFSALQSAPIEEAKAVLASALGHPNRTVRRAAERTWAEMSLGAMPSVQVRPTEPPPVNPVPVLGRTIQWRLHTTQGLVEIELLGDVAPWHVATLVEMTRQGAYRDLLWHRVVPDFVVQGGDPTGSGWGGPGFTLPAEPSSLDFSRGAVGIADAGLDTGGCQIFIMHSRSPRLEGRYTRVGTVVRGMEVVDRLWMGDRIVKAEVVF